MAAQVAAAPSLDAQLRELWAVRDGFFASDPAAKAALVARRVSSLVAAAAACDASSAEARARSAFVRGRALDAGDAYDPEAEAALSRAVKLAPDDVAAWNALGHAFWKKGDVAGAGDCYEAARARAGDAVSARALSQLARAGPRPADGAFDRSLALARDALRCDLGDGESWYVLGNAHVARFFSRGAGGRDPRDLRFAAKAYASAEAKYAAAWADPPDVGGIRGTFGNPDLFFNRGHLRRYVEDYAGACADFSKARDLDGALPAQDALDDTQRWVRRVEDLVRRKGALKPKRRHELDAALRSNAGLRAPAAYAEKALADLARAPLGASDADAAAHFRSAANARTFVVLVVALELRRDGAVPPDAYLAFGRGDAATPCVALSVYDGDTAKLAPGAVVVVLDPVVVQVSSPDAGGDGYAAVHCGDAAKILLDGKPLPTVLRATSSSTTN